MHRAGGIGASAGSNPGRWSAVTGRFTPGRRVPQVCEQKGFQYHGAGSGRRGATVVQLVHLPDRQMVSDIPHRATPIIQP